MKQILYTFLIAITLTSCEPPAPAKDTAVAEATTSQADAPATEALDANLEEIASNEALITTALMAAPEASRAGAKVIGYNMAGEFVTLKEGTNEFICLADDPRKDGFSAACYHQDLEPFMARGRALKAEGKNAYDVFDIREEEVKAGKLSMGKSGAPR